MVMCAFVPLLLGGCIAPIAAPSPQQAQEQTSSSPGALPPETQPSPHQPATHGTQHAELASRGPLASTDIPARDPVDLALRLDPSLDPALAAGIRAEGALASIAIGERERFWVLNSDTAAMQPVEAELVHQNERVNAWAQVGQPWNAETIRAAADHFAEATYPALTQVFGSEDNPGVDGDPRIHMLFTTGMGSGAGGYFLARDTVSPAVLETSNGREMFYINLNYAMTLMGQDRLDALLAHEFQHMIHSARDRNEETWVNEGMSELAEDVAGYRNLEDSFAWFAAVTDTQLNAWGAGSGENAPHYAAAYLFLNYLVQRLGIQVVPAIVDETADGIEGIRNVLAAMGAPSFEELFADWVVALAADDLDAPGEPLAYGLLTVDVGPPLTEQSLGALIDIGGRDTVNNFGTDYLSIDPDLAQATLLFEGATESRVSAAGATSGQFAWWGNRADMSDTRLTRAFDLGSIEPGQPLSLTASLWWDIEEDFDYAYLMASRDGEQWQILPGTHTSEPGNGVNDLGPGYTGLSQPDPATGAASWITETFDLSDYAGGPLFVRFEYVTDDAVTRPGVHVDDVRIDAIGYFDDFESGAPGWESEGWLLTDGRLEQRWLLQVIEMAGSKLVAVHRYQTDANGHAAIDLGAMDATSQMYLAISGLTEGTTEPAEYRIAVE